MNRLLRLRQYIEKASFASASDRYSALEIVEDLISNQSLDSKRVKGLRELCGYVECGESSILKIYQDDATGDWFIKQDDKRVAYARSFESVIDAAIAQSVNAADNSNTTIRLCEFSGDEHHDHDEAGYKKLCPHAGFNHCTLHKLPLTFTHDGWRQCCAPCTTPVQIKEST